MSWFQELIDRHERDIATLQTLLHRELERDPLDGETIARQRRLIAELGKMVDDLRRAQR